MKLIRLMLIVSVGVCFVSCRKNGDAVASTAPRLEIRAQIADAQTAAVTAPIDGKVARIAVREGAAVRPGDLLVELKNVGIDRDLAQARAQLGIAEYGLRHRGNSPRPARNDERLHAAKTLLDNRHTKLERYRALFATHDVSRQELEDAENEYAMARRDYLAERDAMAATAPATDPELLRLELEKAKAEETFAEGREKLLTVTAPLAGVVTRIQVAEQDNVFPRDPLVQITNASTVNAQGHVAPELMSYIHPGMPVEVKVFTVPPRNFLEPVKAVGPEGTVVVSLPNPDHVLQPGISALITVR